MIKESFRTLVVSYRVVFKKLTELLTPVCYYVSANQKETVSFDLMTVKDTHAQMFKDSTVEDDR